MWHEENKLGRKFQEMTEKSRQLLGQTLNLQDARRKYQSQVNICQIKPCSILCNMGTLNMMMMDVARQNAEPKHSGNFTTTERRLECLSRVYDISRIKKKGSTFVLTGKMPEERDWMQLNFDISDSDAALHMSVRQNDKVTVFNNKKNNEWCYEEREHWFPFKRGHMYTFTFHMQNNGTMISVNDEFFYYFKHRMNIEKIIRIRTDLEYELNSCCVVDRDLPKLMVSPSKVISAKIRQNTELAIAQTLEDLMTDDEDDDDDGLEDSFEMIDDESETDENFKSLEPNGESCIEKQKLQDSNEIFQEVSKLVKKYGSSLVEKQFKALALRENSNLAGRCDQPLMEHKLPNPKKHFQVYITELENGFELGSIFVFSCVIDTGCCIILRKSENDNYSETEFSFEPSRNQVIMTKYGEIKMKCRIQDIALFNGEETEITIKRLEKGFQVYVNKTSCEFFEEEPDLSHFNMIEIRGHGLSNVAYFTKKYNKPQDTLQKLTCINRSCSLKYIPKKAKSFVLTGKMPVHRDWMHINFDISDKDIAVHMSVRQNDKVVVFNNKKNNKWCSEERIYSFPFIRGQTYTFSFDIQLQGTEISVDGSPFYYFKHRMDPEKITRLRSDLEEHHDFCYTVGDTVEQTQTLPINIPTK